MLDFDEMTEEIVESVGFQIVLEIVVGIIEDITEEILDSILDFDEIIEEGALHWAVWSTVTVTVTGKGWKGSRTPPGIPLPLTLPRSSMSCSAARGAAAASPKREERMMVERMAIRTCEDLSGLKTVFKSGWFWRCDCCGVRLGC